MAYKCVFSDIDGTLLNSKHQISEKTKKKVQQLAIQNIPFCPWFRQECLKECIIF